VPRSALVLLVTCVLGRPGNVESEAVTAISQRFRLANARARTCSCRIDARVPTFHVSRGGTTRD
jgi:hypothetical protein